MGTLRIEALGSDGQWREFATLTADDPPGSMSSNLPGGARDVILFACAGDHSTVSRSAAGADFETGPARVVATVGTDELARLGPGESYQQEITTDRGTATTIRWTHDGGG